MVSHTPTFLSRDPANGPPGQYVERIVARSRSSFLWAMRIAPRERRLAMYAIYAFCRTVDDVADEPGDLADKHNRIAAWRDEIDRLYAGRPERPITRALLAPVRRFDLPREEFIAVLDGVATDVAPCVRMDSVTDVLGYCRRVAGSVGMLSIRVFGVPDGPGPRIAEALGNALQLTNILRDIREDADLDRIYVPREVLARHAVVSDDVDAVLAHPGFASACADLAELARVLRRGGGGDVATAVAADRSGAGHAAGVSPDPRPARGARLAAPRRTRPTVAGAQTLAGGTLRVRLTGAAASQPPGVM